jgi:hypothetical protein
MSLPPLKEFPKNTQFLRLPNRAVLNQVSSPEMNNDPQFTQNKGIEIGGIERHQALNTLISNDVEELPKHLMIRKSKIPVYSFQRRYHPTISSHDEFRATKMSSKYKIANEHFFNRRKRETLRSQQLVQKQEVIVGRRKLNDKIQLLRSRKLPKIDTGYL